MIFPVYPSKSSIEKLSASIATITPLYGESWVEEYSFYHRDRLALDLEWASKNFSKNSRLLEIGGNPFFLTHALQALGISIECVDKLDPHAKSVTEAANLTARECDIEIESLPYSSNTFDEILFNEVFEHLRINPIWTTEEIFRVLRPGGRIWLSTPNLGSLKGIANLIFRNEAWAVAGEGPYQQYKHLSAFGWMGHVREYTSREVCDFLKQVGFVDVLVSYRGHYKNPLAEFPSRLVPRLRPYFTCIASKPLL